MLRMMTVLIAIIDIIILALNNMTDTKKQIRKLAKIARDDFNNVRVVDAVNRIQTVNIIERERSWSGMDTAILIIGNEK